LEKTVRLIEKRKFREGRKRETNPTAQPEAIETRGIVAAEMQEQNQQGEANCRLKEGNTLEALIGHHSGSSLVV
jgi:hypothetical protein